MDTQSRSNIIKRILKEFSASHPNATSVSRSGLMWLLSTLSLDGLKAFLSPQGSTQKPSPSEDKADTSKTP